MMGNIRNCRLIKTYLTYLMLFFFVFIGLTGCQTAKNTTTATVDRVIDGDTVKVIIGDQTETIRMLLIDTPESVHPTKPVQPFGKEASNYLKEMLPSGTKVELEYDVEKRDKYSRLLAYIWLDDKMMNEALVEEGFARVAYIYEPNTKYETRLKKVEETAKNRKIGIWSIPNYVTDRGFESDVQVPSQNGAKSNSSTCDQPLIKGNITRSGEKIYHTPASPQYKVTKAEEMFCTEEDAVKAGFRKAG